MYSVLLQQYSRAQGLNGLVNNQSGLGAQIGGLGGLYPHVANLRRYNAGTDELVPVSQEWVDDVQREIVETWEKLREAKVEIVRLRAMLPVPELPIAETERMWRAIVAAASY